MEVVNYDRRTQVTTVDIIIREGKNRQIRRMFEGIGHEVKSITRVSHGPIRIKNLRPGEWRELEQVCRFRSDQTVGNNHLAVAMLLCLVW